MTERNTHVSIKLRIPIDILSDTLKGYLINGEIDKQLLLENLQSEFNGPYNQRVGLNHIVAIITDPAISEFLKERKEELLAALNSKTDVAVIANALINIHFSYCYYLTETLAKHLNIEDELSRSVIQNIVGKRFPMNAAGLASFRRGLSQIIDGGLISRVSRGIYAKAEPLKPRHKVSVDLWTESYFINNPLLDRSDYESLNFEPYFSYINLN